MRKFTRFMVAVDTLLVAGISLALLAWWIFGMMGVDAFLRPALDALACGIADPSLRPTLGAVGAGILFLHLVWMERVVRARASRSVIVLQKPDGTLILAVSAIEDSLERAVKQQSGVREVRVRVQPSLEPEGPMGVVVVASIHDSEGIHAVEERMRQAVRKRFGEVLPGRELRVSVRIRRFVAEEAKRERRDEPERVYRGPEYPIEGF